MTTVPTAVSRLGPRVWFLSLVVSVIVVNILAWSNALGGYFLADDYWHTHLIYRALHGEPQVIWGQFLAPTSFRDSIYLMYRPLITPTFLLDYLVWGINAFGYHLTNLIIHSLVAVLVGITTRLLLTWWLLDDDKDQIIDGSIAWLIPFMVAIMFAAYPGQAEPACWTLTRIDSLAGLWYMLSLIAGMRYARENAKGWLVAAMLSLIVGLLVKESCITIPLVLTILFAVKKSGWIWGQRLAAGEWLKTLIASFRSLLPLWAVLPIYMIVRAVALSTCFGGSIGTVGHILNQSFFDRLFLQDIFLVYLHPVNPQVLPVSSLPYQILSGTYLIMAVLVLLGYAKTRCLPMRIKVALPLMLLAVLIILPSLQNWVVVAGLLGLRLGYTASSFFILAILLLIYPIRSQPGTERLRWAAIALFCVYLATSIFVSSKQAKAYCDAGIESNLLRQQTVEKTEMLAPDQKLVILNIPAWRLGIPMFFTMSYLDGLFTPPLTEKSILNKVISLDGQPLNSALLNYSRMKELMLSGDKCSFAVWNMDARLLNTMAFPSSITPVNCELSVQPFSKISDPKIAGEMSYRKPGDDWTSYALVSQKRLSPAEAEFIELDISCVPRPRREDRQKSLAEYFGLPETVELKENEVEITVGFPGKWPQPYALLSWNSLDVNRREYCIAVPLEPNLAKKTYRVNLTEHKRWLLSGGASSFRLDFPSRSWNCSLDAARVVSGETIVPKLSFAGRGDLNLEGLFATDKENLRFDYDATSIAGANKVLVEVSKPYTEFGFLAGTFRESKPSKLAQYSFVASDLKGELTVPPEAVPKKADYQIRICAMDEQGKLLGTFSDPVTVTTTEGLP